MASLICNTTLSCKVYQTETRTSTNVFSGHEQLDGPIVLTVLREELRAFRQQAGVRVFVEILRNELQRAELLVLERQVYRLCKVTRLRHCLMFQIHEIISKLTKHYMKTVYETLIK